MKTDYQVLLPAGVVLHDTVNWPRDPGFDRIRNLVEPFLFNAHMERVLVWHDDQYTDMFVDEAGALKGLPINEAATEIYHANMKTHRPDGYGKAAGAGVLPKIRGPAVLFARPVWF